MNTQRKTLRQFVDDDLGRLAPTYSRYSSWLRGAEARMQRAREEGTIKDVFSQTITDDSVLLFSRYLVGEISRELHNLDLEPGQWKLYQEILHFGHQLLTNIYWLARSMGVLIINIEDVNPPLSTSDSLRRAAGTR